MELLLKWPGLHMSLKGQCYCEVAQYLSERPNTQNVMGDGPMYNDIVRKLKLCR